MARWEKEYGSLSGNTGRTEPRARTKVVEESYSKAFSIVVRESTLADLEDIARAGGYKSRNAFINEILESYIDDYYKQKAKGKK